jgi:PAS domain-containing protein
MNLIIYTFGIAVICSLILLLIILLNNCKKINAAKQETENKNKLIDTFINASTNMVYLKDENFKYVFANKNVQEFYNKTAEEIIGKDDFSISDNDFAKARRESDKLVIKNKALISEETEIKGRVFNTIKFPVNMLNNKTE